MTELENILYWNREQRIIFVTGAGISKDAGVPTFRGDKGIWSSETLHMGQLKTYREDPIAWYKWYDTILHSINTANYSKGNASLNNMRKSFRHLLINQNIDPFLEEGPNHYHIHGKAFHYRCENINCEKYQQVQKLFLKNYEPLCSCGTLVRPHMLFFDESYTSHPDYGYYDIIENMHNYNLCIYIGTSFSVGITEDVYDIAKECNIRQYSINPEPPPKTYNDIEWIENTWENYIFRLGY